MCFGKPCNDCLFRNDDYPPLLGKGSASSRIMFVGENPSWADGQQYAFSPGTVSGDALDRYYLTPLGLSRDNVWVTDLIKCRYPKSPVDIYHNKLKYKTEIHAVAERCADLWLVEEINHVKPKILVTLSDKEVYQRIRNIYSLKTPAKFADAVGLSWQVIIGGHQMILFPMIHPDISRPIGDGGNRKYSVRLKWQPLHAEEHIVSLVRVVNGG